MNILSTLNLTKTYGTGDNVVHALTDVSLDIEEGKFVSIIGSSGSGKSTLLNLLGGLDRPTSGDVILDGKAIFEMDDEALTIFRRRKIGFVFQNYNLVPILNVYENIVLPIELDGTKIDTAYVDKIMDVLGLSEKKFSMPNQLSGGQQQRVAIARALAAKTSIYKWKVMAILLLLGLWGSMFSQALFFAQTPRTPLFVLIAPEAGFIGQLTGGLFIYREGILYGAVQGLRSASMLALGLLVCWTSDPRQLLQALLAWRLPPQMAFMLVTAIRFLPVLAAETGEVITALQLRSDSQSGRTAVLRHLPYIAKPLLARCLRRAQTLALSVVSRGFFAGGAAKRRQQWDAREKASCLLLFAVVVAVVGSKIIYLLSEQGFYFGVFRQIYDWTVLYL